jgi:hypothetical protein
MCETAGAAGETASCFWLYSDGEGGTANGVCRDKTDASLSCDMAKRKEQCEDGSVGKFGTDECFWLVGKGCEDKVYGWEFYYFYFIFFYYFFF